MDDMFSAEMRASRLKEERKRLKFIQKKCAEIVDVREATWIRFEKYGEPLNQDHIYALQGAGFDMPFVVFGIRIDESLKEVKPEQFELLRLLNQVDESKQAKIIQMIQLMVAEG